MATTQENLQEAFAGESKANRMYTAFARKAAKEGFPNVAKLFRTAAEAETIHALGHFDAMDGVHSTAENLAEAIKNETYEHTTMYPPMIEKAEADGHKAKRMFKFASSAEAIHAKLYTAALEAVKSGKDLAESNIYLCPICGHIEFGTPPTSCPICNAKGAVFEQVG